ncbi:hypothetical protein P7K49_003675 [Saguinus oedipus]|uniref:Transcription initiation factor TFIID subunit 7 n=1 Tax=Saguinus oedipus TaxID=9490 RepID=A0ABQ9W591_SAGOE|nr:hypothetical protein P7K49_003675 [Saguinus oedipus]
MFPEARTPPSPGITRKSKSHRAPKRSRKSAGLAGAESVSFLELPTSKYFETNSPYETLPFSSRKSSSREKTKFTLGTVIALLRLRTPGSALPPGQAVTHSHLPPRAVTYTSFSAGLGTQSEVRRADGCCAAGCGSRQDFALPLPGPFITFIGEVSHKEIKMSKSKDDAPHELESQFILRLPPEYASTVRRAVQSGHVNLKDRLTIELHPDGRHGIVRVDRVPLASKLVDLPCVMESLKTIDKKTFYKTADISQMLVATVDGDLYPPVEEPVASTDPKASKKKDKDKEKKFVWNHGITLPLKNVRKRRFRKTAKKKYIESPDVEKEVKRLLSTDAEAVSTRWEIIAEDETKEAENQGLDLSSPGMSGHRQGHDSLEHDELREIFNDLSSSSEDEDETQHQDEEDINIIDTEEDLERQLQEKLNASDDQHQKNEGTNQLVMGIQKQIDNMKGKLQETQDRAKRQEDLIMKVENLALKNRFQAVLDELKQKEDREKEQLSSLQEELESLLEK